MILIIKERAIREGEASGTELFGLIEVLKNIHRTRVIRFQAYVTLLSYSFTARVVITFQV